MHEPSSSSAHQTLIVSDDGSDGARPASSSLPTLADEHGRRHSLPNFAEWSVQHSATAEGRLGLIDALSATPVAYEAPAWPSSRGAARVDDSLRR